MSDTKHNSSKVNAGGYKGVFLSIIVSLVGSSIAAETLTGTASVIDADTIEIHGQRIRLEGIDAPESGQHCYHSNGTAWRCGQQASLAIANVIGRRSVACRINSVDHYGRGLGTCYLGQTDLNGLIVNQGWALAYTRYSTRYVADQNIAQASRSGIWNSRFVAPWDWRRGARIK